MLIAVRGPLFLLVKLLLPSRNANTLYHARTSVQSSVNSTRRFRARPSSVSLVSIGSESPCPAVESRLGSTWYRSTSAFFTDADRRCERSRLYFWPPNDDLASYRNSSSCGYKRGFTSAGERSRTRSVRSCALCRSLLPCPNPAPRVTPSPLTSRSKSESFL